MGRVSETSLRGSKTRSAIRFFLPAKDEEGRADQKRDAPHRADTIHTGPILEAARRVAPGLARLRPATTIKQG